jgi:hypothetical protein
MNLPKMLEELRRQRDVMDEVIANLERLLAATGTPKRGRPRGSSKRIVVVKPEAA